MWQHLVSYNLLCACNNHFSVTNKSVCKERDKERGLFLGICLLGEAFAYSEAACSQEFSAQPRCSFAFVLLSSGSVVEREFSAPLLLSQLRERTFFHHLPLNCHVHKCKGWVVLRGRKNCNHSFFLFAGLFLFTVSNCCSVSAECLMKGYSFSIRSAYLLCCRWKEWGNGISSS